MSHNSEFLAAQPVGANFELFEQAIASDRHEVGAEQLLIDPESGIVLRQLIDLQGNITTDHEELAKRQILLNSLPACVPVAEHIMYRGSHGGVVLTEFVNGKTLNEKLLSILEKGIDGRAMSAVVAPINTIFTALMEDYAEKIWNRQPVLVDLFKSNQWIVGPTRKQKRPRPVLVDTDMFMVGDTPGRYSELEKLQLLMHVLFQATALCVFLNNVSKHPAASSKQMFQPILEAFYGLADAFCGAEIETGETPHLIEILKMIVEQCQTNESVDNEAMFALQHVRQLYKI